MARKYYLVSDNGDNQKICMDKNDEIQIKGRNLRIMKVEYLDEDEIETINKNYDKLIGGKIGHKIKAAFNAFIDSSYYVAMIAYLLLFMLSSIIGDFPAISLFLLLFSVFSVILDIFSYFMDLTNDQKKIRIFFLFVLSLIGTIVFGKLYPEITNSRFGTVWECSILIFIYSSEMLKSIKKSYRKYCRTN